MNERGLMSQPASSQTDLDLVVRPGLKNRDLSTTRQSSAHPTNKLNMQAAKKLSHERSLLGIQSRATFPGKRSIS